MIKLKHILNEILNLNKTLRVFDFDDTLIKSNSKVIVHNSGETKYLTPAEFAIYEPKVGDKFDYSEFQKVVEPKQIRYTFNILKNLIKTSDKPDRKLSILTARGSSANSNIRKYLDDQGINTKNIEIITLGDANPQEKANWIAKQIENGYVNVEFWDDSYKNLQAVGDLKNKYPNANIRLRDTSKLLHELSLKESI